HRVLFMFVLLGLLLLVFLKTGGTQFGLIVEAVGIDDALALAAGTAAAGAAMEARDAVDLQAAGAAGVIAQAAGADAGVTEVVLTTLTAKQVILCCGPPAV